MKIKERIATLVTKALCESTDQQTIISLGRRILPDYDYYRSMGMSESLSVPKQEIARHLVNEIRAQNQFIELVTLLLVASHEGVNGRIYKFNHLRNILKEFQDSGLLFDWEEKQFMEDPSVNRTKNWGVLQEGENYLFTFFRVDIVGNTETVRGNNAEKVRIVYKVIKQYLQDIVEERHGRIWRWAGDGGIIAFYYQKRNENAVLCAIEMLHRLFIFNHFSNPLDRPVEMRMAINIGYCRFTSDEGDLLHNDTLKSLMALESQHTEANSLTITEEVWNHMEPDLASRFKRTTRKGSSALHNYKLRWKD